MPKCGAGEISRTNKTCEKSGTGSDISKEFSIEIADKNLSPLYLARVLENATVAQSPAWLRYRLHSVGVRAISNLVDVTNYILMELGQPLHAFDLDKIEGKSIFVASAKQDEKFTTLDGQERLLLAGDISIRDSKGSIALGGVMGGLNTEITSSTKNILLEGAIFNPLNIRRTARRLGLQSDASYRFERGVDQCNTLYATNRAAMLMAELSGASLRLGVARAEPAPWQAPKMFLRKKRIDSLLGISLENNFCEQTLEKLGCELEKNSTLKTLACELEKNFTLENIGDLREKDFICTDELPVWNVQTPSHRPDLSREVDLIEELVRVHGVDKVPAVVPEIARSLERTGQARSAHLFRS
ncbi:MAG: phenylalanine--tRNA ligase beta subunit-related protein, partial [Candidatus Adiutrix sp.]